jgi:hypothetical protein
MSGNLKVTVAGLDFYGQGDHPFMIGKDGFVGWDDGVDMRIENAARPQAHGSFNAPGFQDARTISLTGGVAAETNPVLRHLGHRLTGLLAGGQQDRIQVDRDGDVMWADCQLASKTKFTEDGGTEADYQIQLWCPDPRKFGVTREEELISGQSRTLVHYGNYDASPLVVINGPVAGGYTLSSNEGRVYRVNAGIAAGHTHSVDMNDGLLRVNGQVQAGLVGRADIWEIPPGLLPDGSTLNMALFPDSGTATGTVYITDTYI